MHDNRALSEMLSQVFDKQPDPAGRAADESSGRRSAVAEGDPDLRAATQKARKLEQKAIFDKLTSRIASLTEQLEQSQQYTTKIKSQRDRWERTCKEMSEAKQEAIKHGRATNLAARFAMAARVERERSRQAWWSEGGRQPRMVDR